LRLIRLFCHHNLFIYRFIQMILNRENFETIIRYLRPHKKAIIITAFFVFLENAILLVAPILYGKIIDLVMQNKKFTLTVIVFLAIWIFLDLIKEWFVRIRYRKSQKIAYLSSQDLITDSIKYMLQLPLSFHRNKRVGEIIQRFSRADQYLYGFVEDGLFSVVPNLIFSFLACSIIGWINWKLAVLYIIFVLIYVFLVVKKTNPIVGYQKKINKVFEKTYGDIFDRTINIVAIKSNSAEEREHERNLKNFHKGFGFFNRQITLWMNLEMWKNWIFSLGFLVLFMLGLYFVNLGEITIGQFVMVLAYVNMFSLSVYSLGSNYKNLQEGIVTINRADKIFEEIPENYADKKGIVVKNCLGEVEFKNVYFSYENKPILEDINFKAGAGKMIAIVGKSGEGKSTLVDLISRYIVPEKGKITLDGIDTGKINLKSLRDLIAIVPQEVMLFNDTIKNNILYSNPQAMDEEIFRAAELANCTEFIEKMPRKYSQMVGERGVQLSAGQKQRVAIARAVLRNPKILILDEATSALDSESEKYIQEALEEVKRNRTTFVIAHRLSTIRKADLILVIEKGRIIEEGDHQELIEKGGVYQKLSELQQLSV
jgi:ABC-type multidrug transport system fused ATPase/permease subunit